MLIDVDVFDSETALYDDRTAGPGDDSQDGGDLDGIYPRTAIGPGGETVDAPYR